MYLCTKIVEKQQDMDTKKTLTVKQWDDADKPRERLLNLGKKQLSNAELIAILLRSGTTGKSVLDMSREVLAASNNSLTNLARMELKQLETIKGMAEAKAATLIAALELGWRMQGEIEAEKQVFINDSNDLYHLLMPTLIDLNHEEFWLVLLNNQNRLLGRHRIAIGGQTETTVDMRVVFRLALEGKATRIAVAHNHPSGSIKPSSEDRKLTQRIKEAGDLLSIKLTDHIIIGLNNGKKGDYYSFNDNGYL